MSGSRDAEEAPGFSAFFWLIASLSFAAFFFSAVFLAIAVVGGQCSLVSVQSDATVFGQHDVEVIASVNAHLIEMYPSNEPMAEVLLESNRKISQREGSNIILSYNMGIGPTLLGVKSDGTQTMQEP